MAAVFFVVMASERTFIAIKPDGVQRGLVGEIVGRFERKGFKLVGLKQLTPAASWLSSTTASTRSVRSSLVLLSSSPPALWWRWWKAMV